MVLLIIVYLEGFQNHLLHLELLERPVCVLRKSHPCTYSVGLFLFVCLFVSKMVNLGRVATLKQGS